MKMERVMIQLPKQLKDKLDGMRRQGTTASGYIRNLLERELSTTKKGR
jgi:metal-responsive CopG/Arc/MetJ family transcriptional regulator